MSKVKFTPGELYILRKLSEEKLFNDRTADLAQELYTTVFSINSLKRKLRQKDLEDNEKTLK